MAKRLSDLKKTDSSICIFDAVNKTFKAYEEIRDLIRDIEKKNGEPISWHEVIMGDRRAKIFVDLDAEMKSLSEFREAIKVIKAGLMDLCLAKDIIINDNDIDVYESVTEGLIKKGAHIVLMVTAPGLLEMKKFIFDLKNMVPESVSKMIDMGPYAKIHNLRLYGSYKYVNGQFERKKVLNSPYSREEEDIMNRSLISKTNECIHLKMDKINSYGNVSDKTNIKPVIDLIDQLYPNVHIYRKQIRNDSSLFIIFDRRRPSQCNICHRQHDHENSLYVQICDNKIIEHCRRSSEFRILGPFELHKSESEYVSGWDRIVYDSENIRDVTDQEYDNRTIAIKAMMKMGKTKMMQKLIKDRIGELETVVMLSFRKTFSRTLLEKFPNFTLYSDVRGQITDRKLIIQIESLWRIVPAVFGKVDLLIMDESESLIEQLESGLSKRAYSNMAVFIWLLEHSKKCIAMDAFLGNRTLSVLGKRTGNKIFIKNKYKNMKDYTYRFFSDTMVFHNALYQDILNGKKTVICTNVRNEAETLKNLLLKFHKDLKVGIYSAKSTSDERKHFEDVNKYWDLYDVLIYTPTITAGVSFEKMHYDKIAGYFYDRSCNAQAAMQMMGRIRNLEDRIIDIYIDNESPVSKFPETKSDIIKMLTFEKNALVTFDFKYDENGLITIEDNIMSEIRIQNMIERNKSWNGYQEQMREFIEEAGSCVVRIHDLPLNSSYAKIHIGSLKKTKTLEYTHIINANELEDQEYESFKNDRAEHFYEIKKYEFRKDYNYQGEIDIELLETYYSQEIRHKFKNISDIAAEYYVDRDMKATMFRLFSRYRESILMTDIIGNNYFELFSGSKYEIHHLIYRELNALGFTGIFDTGIIPTRQESPSWQFCKYFGQENINEVLMKEYGINLVTSDNFSHLELPDIFKINLNGQVTIRI